MLFQENGIVFFVHPYNFIKIKSMKGFFMRKLILVWVFILTLVLVSCEKSPTMSELLIYQNEDFSMTLRVTDGEVFDAILTHKENTLTLMLTGKDETEGITFTEREGTSAVSFESTALALPDTALSKASTWLSLFHLSADGLWKIRKDTLGGIEVFICTESDSGVALYLDAVTRMPLKITLEGGATVDVLSVSR